MLTRRFEAATYMFRVPHPRYGRLVLSTVLDARAAPSMVRLCRPPQRSLIAEFYAHPGQFIDPGDGQLSCPLSAAGLNPVCRLASPTP